MLHECARRLKRAPVTLPIHSVQNIAPSNLIYFTAVSIVSMLFMVYHFCFSVYHCIYMHIQYMHKFKSRIGRIRYAFHLFTAGGKYVRTEFRTDFV